MHISISVSEKDIYLTQTLNNKLLISLVRLVLETQIDCGQWRANGILNSRLTSCYVCFIICCLKFSFVGVSVLSKNISSK
jgi:hypothetical protein